MPEWLHGVLEAIFGSLLYELLLAGAVAALMTWLKKIKPNWAAPVLYGLLGFIGILVMAYVFTGHALLAHEPQITPENIEENVKAWCDSVSIGLQRTLLLDTYWSYTARLSGADPIEIFRGKEKPGYLQFKATIKFSPEHQVALSKLTKIQTQRFFRRLELELSKMRMTTVVARAINNGKPIETGVVLQRGVRISSLNQDLFVDSFDEMTKAAATVKAVVNLTFAEGNN